MSDALDDKNGEGLDWSLPARLRRVATTLGDAMHNEAADRIEQLERELAQAKRDIEFDKQETPRTTAYNNRGEQQGSESLRSQSRDSSARENVADCPAADPRPSQPDKYGALKRLHEAIRRLAPQFKTQFAPQAWDDIPSAEKDCVAAALEEVFPSAEGNSKTANPERRSSLEHSEIKPDGDEGRSGEVNREGGSSAATARGDAVGAGGAECGSRSSGREADRQDLNVAGGAFSAPSHEGSIPYIDRSEAVNLARNVVPSAPDYRPGEHQITPKGIRCLAEAVLKMDEAIRCAGSATGTMRFTPMLVPSQNGPLNAAIEMRPDPLGAWVRA